MSTAKRMAAAGETYRDITAACDVDSHFATMAMRCCPGVVVKRQWLVLHHEIGAAHGGNHREGDKRLACVAKHAFLGLLSRCECIGNGTTTPTPSFTTPRPWEFQSTPPGPAEGRSCGGVWRRGVSCGGFLGGRGRSESGSVGLKPSGLKLFGLKFFYVRLAALPPRGNVLQSAFV